MRSSRSTPPDANTACASCGFGSVMGLSAAVRLQSRHLGSEIEPILCHCFTRRRSHSWLCRPAAGGAPYAMAATMRSAVSGRSRTRTCSASNNALAIAAAVGPAASLAGTHRCGIRWHDVHVDRRHFGEAQDRIALPRVAGDALGIELHGLFQRPAGGLDRAALICAHTPSRLIARPTSTAIVRRRTRSCAPASTATTAHHAPVFL